MLHKNNRRGNRTQTKRNNNTKRQISQQVHSDLGLTMARPNQRDMRNRVQSESKCVKMRFQSDLLSLNSSGNFFATKSFLANGLYDPDPALLTSSVAGFAEWMRLYNYAQVITNRTTVVLTNNETFPIKACLLYTLDDPSTSLGSVQNCIDAGENAMATKWVQLAPVSGQNRSRLTLTVNIPKTLGHEMHYYSMEWFYNYPSSNPAQPQYMTVLIASSTALTGAGIGLSFTMDYSVKLFYRRLVLDSGPSQQVRKINSLIDTLTGEIELLSSQFRTFQLVGQDTASIQSCLLSKQERVKVLKSYLLDPYSSIEIDAHSSETISPFLGRSSDPHANLNPIDNGVEEGANGLIINGNAPVTMQTRHPAEGRNVKGHAGLFPT